MVDNYKVMLTKGNVGESKTEREIKIEKKKVIVRRVVILSFFIDSENAIYQPIDDAKDGES